MSASVSVRSGHRSAKYATTSSFAIARLELFMRTKKTVSARIGERVGQRNLAVTANTYTHVLADELELEYAALLI